MTDTDHASAAMSRDSIAYEAIQRIYRPALVRHIRHALRQKYGDEAVAKLRRPFRPEQWAEVVEGAALARASGTVSASAEDDFDLLDVAHFANVIDAEFDLFFPGTEAEPPRNRAARKEAVLRFVRMVKAVRDPISHPVVAEMDLRDARLCIDSARRVALLIDIDSERRLAELLDGLDQSSPSAEPLEVLLPPSDAPDGRFIGRQRELLELESWLQDRDTRRWLLAGGGGRGKTAIAHQFARRVRDRGGDHFQLILWLTAKRRTFVEGDVVSAPSPDFHDLPSALDRILDAFGWLTDAPPDVPERRRLVIELLTELPVLLIADDIDSLESENEAVTEFLAQVAYATPSRVLMTSRRAVMGMGGSSTVVEGLAPSDAADFLAARLTFLGFSEDSFDADRRHKILEVTDRVPLFIDDLLRLSAAGVRADEAIRLWRERGGERAREFALGREAELLSADAVQVLLATALQDQPVSYDELRLVTGLATEDVISALGELQKLFLLPRPRLIESVERFVLDGNTRALVRDVLLPRYPDTVKRLRGALRELVGDVSRSALHHRRVGEYVRQAVFLVMSDRHSEAEETLQAGLQEFPEDKALLGQIGWVYKNWKPHPRYTDARSSFERARDLGSTDAQMFRHWIEMERSLEQWSVAAEIAEAGLERQPDDQTLRYQAGYTTLRWARDLPVGDNRTIELVRSAANHLRMAIRDPSVGPGVRARVTTSKAYRSLCYALYEEMLQLERRRGAPDPSRIQHLGADLYRTVTDWKAAYPDDPYAAEMAVRLDQWKIAQRLGRTQT